MLEPVVKGVIVSPAAKADTIQSGISSSVALPKEGSVVLLNILEKLEGAYRILIDGKLFQAQLFIPLKKGDWLLGLVLKQNPLKISANLNVSGNEGLEHYAGGLLSRLGIEDSESGRKLVLEILRQKKPLLKEKIELAEAYIKDHQLFMADLSLKLLIEFLWSEGNDMGASELNEIFLLPFECLAELIFNSVKRLNSLEKKPKITEDINELFILDAEGEFSYKEAYKLRNKSRGALEIIKLLKNAAYYQGEASEILLSLKALLIRYIIQQSLFHSFSMYPDFLIIRNRLGLELILYRFETQPGSEGTIHSMLFSQNLPVLGSAAVRAFFYGSKFWGEVIVALDNIGPMVKCLDSLNSEVFRILGVDSKLMAATRSQGLNLPHAIGNLDRKV